MFSSVSVANLVDREQEDAAAATLPAPQRFQLTEDVGVSRRSRPSRDAQCIARRASTARKNQTAELVKQQVQRIGAAASSTPGASSATSRLQAMRERMKLKEASSA